MRRRRTVCANFVIADSRLVARTAGAVHGQPGHSPQAARRRARARRARRPIRSSRGSIRTAVASTAASRLPRRGHSSPASRGRASWCSASRRARRGVLPALPTAPTCGGARSVLAFTRTGAPRARLPEAAQPQPPAIDPRRFDAALDEALRRAAAAPAARGGAPGAEQTAGAGDEDFALEISARS